MIQPQEVYVVLQSVGEDDGLSIEGVYASRQTADQVAERVFGYAYVSIQRVQTAVPEYFHRSGKKAR